MCAFLGYSFAEMEGRQIQPLTDTDMIDIARHFAAGFHFICFRGLWIFVGKRGTRLLARYESQLRPDLSVEISTDATGWRFF